MASEIVTDVLFVHKNYKGGSSALIFCTESPESAWAHTGEDSHGTLESHAVKTNNNHLDIVKEWVRLFTSAVSWWVLPVVAAWSAGVVGLAYLVSEKFPIEGEQCPQGFCSRIAVSGDVKKYVGFALFLLLGFRLYDSHWRYVEAQKAWQHGLRGIAGILSNRMFASMRDGMFHPKDLDRIAAHLAAFVMVTVSKLRRSPVDPKPLSTFMHPEDVTRIEKAPEPGDYCLDVVRAYMTRADELFCSGTKVSLGVQEAFQTFLYIPKLRDHASFCERILKIPLPFGYIEHTRVFLVIWILLLPLGIVEDQGWYAIVWTVIVAYGLIGVEKWSTELADPFGLDISDIPLHELSSEVVDAIKTNLITFKRRGVASVVIPDRECLRAEPDLVLKIE